MNFLAHAHLALRRSADPAYVLGAMLPDFATMARVRLAAQSHPEVAAGVALHHRSDTAFHAHPDFVELARQVTEGLRAREVAHGPARAVGHIGVEMLLDGELLELAPLRRAYTRALNAAAGLPLATRDPADAQRLSALVRRLEGLGVPWDYRSPAAVTFRLFRALERRPRLRPRAGDAAAIRRVLADVQGTVRARTPPIVAAVDAASDAPDPSG